MEIDERFARYILSLMSIADLEQGANYSDAEYQDKIENAFPNLKKEREDKEFKDWVWNKKLEEDLEISKKRKEIEYKIANTHLYDKSFVQTKEKKYKEWGNDPKIMETLRRQWKIEKAVEKMKRENKNDEFMQCTKIINNGFIKASQIITGRLKRSHNNI